MTNCKSCCFYGEASGMCHRAPGVSGEATARCSHYLPSNDATHLLNWRDAPSCGGEPFSAAGTTDIRRVTCQDCLMLFKAFGSTTAEEMD